MGKRDFLGGWAIKRTRNCNVALVLPPRYTQPLVNNKASKKHMTMHWFALSHQLCVNFDPIYLGTPTSGIIVHMLCQLHGTCNRRGFCSLTIYYRKCCFTHICQKLNKFMARLISDAKAYELYLSSSMAAAGAMQCNNHKVLLYISFDLKSSIQWRERKRAFKCINFLNIYHSLN